MKTIKYLVDPDGYCLLRCPHQECNQIRIGSALESIKCPYFVDNDGGSVKCSYPKPADRADQVNLE